MNRFVALSVCLLASFASPVWSADQPVVKGDLKVAPYKLVRLTLEGADPKAGVVWKVSPSKDVDKAKRATKTRLEFTAPPGTYEVSIQTHLTGADGTTDSDEVSVTVVIGDPVPKQAVTSAASGETPGPQIPAPSYPVQVYQLGAVAPVTEVYPTYTIQSTPVFQTRCYGKTCQTVQIR